MLAVQQRPQAMASGRHPDHEQNLPFGYAVDSFDEFALQNAPDPAPGNPILTDNEQKALHSFFEEISANNNSIMADVSGGIHSESWNDAIPPDFLGSSTSFGHNPGPHNYLSDYGFSPDLFGGMQLMQLSPPMPPPQATTQAVPTGGLSSSRSNSTPTLSAGFMHHTSGTLGIQSGIDHRQQQSDEVLQAAALMQMRSTSFHYGSRPNNLAQQHQTVLRLGLMPEGSQPMPTSTMSPSALLSPVGHNGGHQQLPIGVPAHALVHAAHTHISNSLQTVRPAGLMYSTDANTAQQASSLGTANQRQALSWGSDKNFGQTQFTPQSEKETSDALLHERLRTMECLEVSQSAATTQPSTPTNEASFMPFNLKTRTVSFVAAEAEANGRPEVAPPRKRRKSKVVKSEETDQSIEEEEDAVFGEFKAAGDDSGDAAGAAAKNGGGKPQRKRKAKAPANGQHLPPQSSASPSAESPPTAANGGSGAGAGGAGGAPGSAKRRRSAASMAASKQPRENLTEEQKRNNHIKSEQKRRTLIKNGFEDLYRMVPGLQGGSVSKSVMLLMTADWLQDVLSGNERLRAQLRQM